MKYTYIIEYEDPTENMDMQQMQMYIMSLMNGVSPEYFKSRHGREIFRGFVPEDKKTTIILTPYDVIKSHIDKKQQAIDDLAVYFGEQTKRSTGYMGKWDNALEDESTIYYMVFDNKVIKIIICPHPDVPNSILYFADLDGNIMDVSPDIGDVIFDDFDEAQKYLFYVNPLLNIR